jgi:tRNA (adenine57-N1/adenine58-N1)-methyltransferase
MAIAQKNITKAGISKYVTMEKLDFKKAKKMPHSEIDLVVVDLGDSWNVVPQARKMLKGSGSFVAICPTMNQLEKLVTVLIQNEFSDIECTEQILRYIDAREGKTRHAFHGIGHTTYIAYARKAFFDKKPVKKTKNTKTKLVTKNKVYSSKK